MTETTRPEPAPDASNFPVDPSDVLLNFIAGVLAPIFLGASGGDLASARLAALETLSAYHPHSQADLIAIAQIIACGLSALRSLSLSMADNLSVPMTLRLRANAAALNRCAERHRHALHGHRPRPAPADQPPPSDPVDSVFHPGDAAREAEVIAGVAAAQRRADEARAHLQSATAQPASGQATQTSAMTGPAHDPRGRNHPNGESPTAPESELPEPARTDFALAGEFITGILHPATRTIPSRRTQALSSCANRLLLNNGPPPPDRARLAALGQPNPAW